MKKTKQIPVRLDIELYEEVKERINDLDRSFNSYILQLIKEDLKEVKKNGQTDRLQ